VVALAALLREARAALEGADGSDAALDARLIVEHFTGTGRADAISRPDLEIPEETARKLRGAVERRAAGEPVHRILGRREFYGLELELSPATLEPRPDTEILVDRLAPRLRAVVATSGECRLLDLGTGTGAIALALLSQVEGASAVGADIAPEAVETARRNAARHGLSGRFEGVVSDWFAGVTGKFHAIVSNPPYISEEEMASLPREVRLYDPERALHGGADGLDAYRRIIAGAEAHLEPEGIVAVEIGHTQRESVTAIFAACDFEVIDAARDLAGRERVLIARRRPKVAS